MGTIDAIPLPEVPSRSILSIDLSGRGSSAAGAAGMHPRAHALLRGRLDQRDHVHGHGERGLQQLVRADLSNFKTPPRLFP